MRLMTVSWSSASRRSASDVEMELRGDGPGRPNRLDQGSRLASRAFDRPQNRAAGGGDPVAYRRGIPRDHIDRLHPQCRCCHRCGANRPSASERSCRPRLVRGSVLPLCTMIRSRPGMTGTARLPRRLIRADRRRSPSMANAAREPYVSEARWARMVPLESPGHVARGPLAAGLLLPMLAGGPIDACSLGPIGVRQGPAAWR
jgi:hypothetical protein